MKGFDWERFVTGKVAVNCDTKEKADDFINKCKEKGFVWCGGDRIIDSNNWDIYRNVSCYAYHRFSQSILSRSPLSPESGLSYADIKWFKENEYKIIKWEIY
jgi:hypothetical protein